MDVLTKEELLQQYNQALTVINDLRARLVKAEELHTMQIVAIMTASIQNTRSTVKDRIDRNNPYWTQAYEDVCVAINREIRERERAEKAEAECAMLRQCNEGLVASEQTMRVEANALRTELHEQNHNYRRLEQECSGMIRQRDAALKERDELRAKWSKIQKAINPLMCIVEGCQNERWECKGRRLIDTNEWCAFYVAWNRLDRITATATKEKQ